jgi:hypothetical protein
MPARARVSFAASQTTPACPFDVYEPGLLALLLQQHQPENASGQSTVLAIL